MWEKLKKEYGTIFAMGAGACELCETCTYPEAPCRLPESKELSMEACGLAVSKVCKDNGLEYSYGKDKMAYTSCYLITGCNEKRGEL